MYGPNDVHGATYGDSGSGCLGVIVVFIATIASLWTIF